MTQYANLWQTLRQVLDIADRNGAGWCQLWTSTAERVLSSKISLSAQVSSLPMGVHHYLATTIPDTGKIEVAGEEVERLLRENARKLEIRQENIPNLEGIQLIGGIVGRPGEPAVLDGTADQFLGSGPGVYRAISMLPVRLAKIYSRKE